MRRELQTYTSGLRVVGSTACMALLQACADPKSSSTGGPDGGPVPTSRMSLDLRVESTDLRIAVVRANLNDGRSFGASYRLDGGDFFEACVNGVCRVMADNDSLSSPDYIARFDYQSDVDFVVSFNRRQDRDAPNSRVILPAAFTIVTPANRQQVTDGETVLVSWTPTGAPAGVTLDYHADCSYLGGWESHLGGSLGVDANGDGRESIRIDRVVDLARQNEPAPLNRCSIDVIVSHELQGRIDPAFHNGTAVGVISRAVTLDYVPR